MMKTEMGEYIVGAYLKLIKECDFIDYNVRRPGGGLAGLDELDVMGLNFEKRTAYLCEVTTHLEGLLYGSSRETTQDRIRRKYDKMRDYAENHLPKKLFPERHFMFWSPVVSLGVKQELEKIEGIELVVGEDYTTCIEQLQNKAKKIAYDTNNPAFRVFQILGHLRRG